MSLAGDYQDPMYSTWESFVSGNFCGDILRPEINNSWNRCWQNNVDPYNNILHHRLDNVAFKQILAEKEDLIIIAKRFMSNLYEFVRGTGFVVVLADEKGYIMELFGDPNVLSTPLTNSFFQSACWQEVEGGTNAIGTVAVIKSPVQISGSEHYCKKHHGLTCSAAPIFNNYQQMIGILDVSGPSYMSHLHTLGMVVSAAEAIMAQFDIRLKNKELAFSNNRLTNIFNTISDGVLLIDKQGLITQINPVAKQILNDVYHDVLGMPIERVFGGKATLAHKLLEHKESYEDIELMIDTKRNGLHCYTSGEPLTDEQGRVIGGVIILRPARQIRNLINRVSGYTAPLQFDNIIGQSTELLEAKRVASLAATTSFNILLQGESGTGKEIFAQAIHNQSDRQNGPFVAVNCGVIPRELIGSELFGYVEGAFTGAKHGGKPGKFELASGGTMFLDEIGDMPLEQQVALLRVLEEKKITRIGGTKVLPINVRFICATNQDLLRNVNNGTFRQDLYYRLNVISLTLPPLRNRHKDISLLFMHFLNKLSHNHEQKLIDPKLMDFLIQYSWPGNVRELQNIVERAISLSESTTLTLANLPSEMYTSLKMLPPPTQTLPSQTLTVKDLCNKHRQLQKETEQQCILTMLAKHGGNVSATARELGIARKTLYRKINAGLACQNTKDK
jgi:sigma-54 dependent transcriptional regulator, acetoin dehydrogenase operon transcriptional activator AcoR